MDKEDKIIRLMVIILILAGIWGYFSIVNDLRSLFRSCVVAVGDDGIIGLRCVKYIPY